MKSAYELAMERLNKVSPTVKLSEEQKAALADLDSRYAAKVAEREIGAKDAIARASASGDFEKVEMIQRELQDDKKRLQTELEEKKEAVRSGKTR